MARRDDEKKIVFDGDATGLERALSDLEAAQKKTAQATKDVADAMEDMARATTDAEKQAAKAALDRAKTEERTSKAREKALNAEIKLQKDLASATNTVDKANDKLGSGFKKLAVSAKAAGTALLASGVGALVALTGTLVGTISKMSDLSDEMMRNKDISEQERIGWVALNQAQRALKDTMDELLSVLASIIGEFRVLGAVFEDVNKSVFGLTGGFADLRDMLLYVEAAFYAVYEVAKFIHYPIRAGAAALGWYAEASKEVREEVKKQSRAHVNNVVSLEKETKALDDYRKKIDDIIKQTRDRWAREAETKKQRDEARAAERKSQNEEAASLQKELDLREKLNELDDSYDNQVLAAQLTLEEELRKIKDENLTKDLEAAKIRAAEVAHAESLRAAERAEQERIDEEDRAREEERKKEFEDGVERLNKMIALKKKEAEEAKKAAEAQRKATQDSIKSYGAGAKGFLEGVGLKEEGAAAEAAVMAGLSVADSLREFALGNPVTGAMHLAAAAKYGVVAGQNIASAASSDSSASTAASATGSYSNPSNNQGSGGGEGRTINVYVDTVAGITDDDARRIAEATSRAQTLRV